MSWGSYRKKPVIIQAIQWDGESDTLRTVMEAGQESRVSIVGDQLLITTLEGTMAAAIGDWIIQGVQGELYPCRDDIFQATYESAEPEADAAD